VNEVLANSLADLAERIKEASAGAAAAERLSVECVLEAGRLLVRGKRACGHGEWLPFLARAGISERKAQRHMQLARSGLNPTQVSDLGGTKAALEFLSRRTLPSSDGVVFVCRAGSFAEDNAAIACVSPSEVEGHFDITVFAPGGAALVTSSRPLRGDPIELPGGRFFAGLWEILARDLNIPMAEWEFVTAPAYLMLDDCAFLASMIERDCSAATVSLPHSYEVMVQALQDCVSNFSPESYFRARRSQRLCLHRMERWPNDPGMVGALSAIAGDLPTQELAAEVDRLAALHFTRQATP
jgi:hypothetical protein